MDAGFHSQDKVQGRDDTVLFSTMLRLAFLVRRNAAHAAILQRPHSLARTGGSFDSEKAMIGSHDVQLSCPASAAIVMVTSLP